MRVKSMVNFPQCACVQDALCQSSGNAVTAPEGGSSTNKAFC